MTFFEYYKSLPGIRQKRAVRKKIIKATMIEPGSFYTWLNRRKIPTLAQSIISDVLNLPQGELFPENEEANI